MKIAIDVSELTARMNSTPTLRSTSATSLANGITAVATSSEDTMITGTAVNASRSAP